MAADSFLSKAPSGLGVFPKGPSPNPALGSQGGEKKVNQAGEEGSSPGRGSRWAVPAWPRTAHGPAWVRGEAGADSRGRRAGP